MIIIGLLVGFLSGLLGVGGGFILVPLQYFLLNYIGVGSDLSFKMALATSLAVISPIAIITAYNHYNESKFDLKPGVILGAFGIFGSFFGAFVAIHLPSNILEILLGVTFILLAINMVYNSYKEKIADYNYQGSGEGKSEHHKLPIINSILLGLAIGFFAGLFSLGGGVFLIPALTILIGFSMISAIRISSVFIAITSFGGIFSYLVNSFYIKTIPYSIGYINLLNIIVIVMFAIPLSYLGTKLVYKANEKILKRIFAIFMIYIGLNLLNLDPFLFILSLL
ncbi:sulfite exporter TauE/SafE family protein [Methanobrevibacter curvatus]|uniref:Probable membrane transporter protein n=1 Tax=Methanobrevibacter curvatus TaxID=49547 RepID=A0A165ZRW1_9EURY|nr:sulfite exporter TauE/SafE family protein [Methanobrevibacter curvatus]KZX11082.1 sulfite exporter TauE/SafE [Methanobrevibacter curvatus]